MNASGKARRLILGITTMTMMAGLSPRLHANLPGSANGEGGISVSPDHGLDFGDLMVGESAVRRVAIVNSGTATLRITALRLHRSEFGYVGALSLPIELMPGARADVDLQFTPATTESIAGTMEIETDTPGNLEYAIRGRGIFPVLIVGRGSIEFGRVGTGETRIDSFMVRNGGTARLREIRVVLSLEQELAFEILSPFGLSATIVARSSRVSPDFVTSGGISFSLSPIVPNPASEHATVCVSAGGSKDIHAVLMVIDNRGQIVATPFDGMIHAGQTMLIQIDPRPLPTGIYQAVLRAAGRYVSTKLVVGR